MKVVFFGTPEFVLPILESLNQTEDIKLLAVVTSPDKPVGRKQVRTPSPVKTWALKHQIPVIDFDFIKEITQKIKELKPDVGVLAAYGKILPKELIDAYPRGILIIHPSLLPAWRGASPVQAALAHSDKETGVTIIQMDEKMDHGPIVAQFKEPIKPDDTAESLYRRLFQLTAHRLPDILAQYLFSCADRHQKKDVQLFLPPKPQDHSKATFCKILKKEDGFIPLEMLGIIASKPGRTSKCKLGPYNLEPTAKNLERFIRAMHPWPGAFTNVKIKNQISKRLKILKAHLEEGELVLDLVQLEGKKPISWKQFKRAYPEIKLM